MKVRVDIHAVKMLALATKMAALPRGRERNTQGALFEEEMRAAGLPPLFKPDARWARKNW